MDFAADCTSAIIFKRNAVHPKPNTSSNSAKGEDFKYIGFDMLKSKEDKDAIFHLDRNFPRFLGFPTIPNLFQWSKKCRSYDAIC